MADFAYDVDSDGIATITWDVPEKSMNVMSQEGFALLDSFVDDALADSKVRGILITSGKKDFAAGMDLNVLARMKRDAGPDPARGLFDGIMRIHGILRKIELAGMDFKTKKGGKPVAAALPGTALGIGYEIPLACHRRFAADNPSARIGLPEIKVGIFPGGGGTTRLSRMIGAMAAAPYLLEGRAVKPQQALAAGLVDEVAPPDELIGRAKKWLLEAKEEDLVKPWDKKGYKMPGGAPYHPSGFMTFLGASVMVHTKTKGVYPAAKALLSAVYEGALTPFDTAVRIEARWFTKVLMDPRSSAMIQSLFINKGALEKGASRPKDIPDQSVRKLGILGAGMMGAGICTVSAQAGMEVVLLDTSQEAAEKGVAHAQGVYEKSAKRGSMSEEAKSKALGRITATTDYGKLEGCDLIIEAVFEDPAIKAEVTKKTEEAIPEDCVFATNTSTLPITELAAASRRPEQFIGIHFFSPVEKMLLVEIIKGERTGDRAVAKALDCVRQIRKTPIVVNDARFFYANRCIIPYINEGVRMVREGVRPALVENAAQLLGMPVGPLQLVDETSIDLGVRIAKATKASMGDAYPSSDADEVMFKLFDLGRLGRKSGAGFYDYNDSGRRTGLWPGLADLWPPSDSQPPVEDVKNRLMFSQSLEAVRALEEGVLMDVREGDVGAILGWGFAPWSGGPFSSIDMMGADRAAEICESLAGTHGERFAPPETLRKMAAEKKRFYAA